MRDLGKAGSYWKIKHKEKRYRNTAGLEWDIFGGEYPDVLVKEEDGTYRKITGMCVGGFIIPDEDLEWVENDTRKLHMTNLSEMSDTYLVKKVEGKDVRSKP